MAAAPVTARASGLTGDLDSMTDSRGIRGSQIHGISAARYLFADQLIAHVDAADGYPVLQIGMDTPQVTAERCWLLLRLLLQIPRCSAWRSAAVGGWVLGIHSAAECVRCAARPAS